MTDYLHFLFEIFLILVQIAGGLSLVAWIVLLVLLKRGYEFNAKFTDEEEL